MTTEQTSDGTTSTTTCESCGLTYFYAPKFHECQDPRVLANLPTTSWVEECMAKQYGRED